MLAVIPQTTNSYKFGSPQYLYDAQPAQENCK